MANCYRILKKRVDDPDTVCMVGPESIKSTRKYLTLVDDFCKTFDFDPEQFVLDAPQGAIYPLLRFKKDSDVYRNVFGQIHKALTSGHRVTAPVIRSYIGIKPIEPKKPTVRPVLSTISIKNPKASAVSNDNSQLLSILKPPQIRILRDAMIKEECDTEYAALVKILAIYSKGSTSKK